QQPVTSYRLPVGPKLHVAADSVQGETTAAGHNPCLGVPPVRAAIAECGRVLVVDAATDGRHRQVDVELSREVESDVAAHGVEVDIAPAGEFLNNHLHVAADGR